MYSNYNKNFVIFNWNRNIIASIANYNFKNLLVYFFGLTIKYHFSISVFGFFLILTFVSQILSGIMLAFSLIPECMLVPIVRDEEDLEDLFTDDFFWLHERGVDVIFIFSYVHFLRKLYLINSYLEQEMAWKSGSFTFILVQLVTFLGLVLCCTHLSDITLKIASNTIYTLLAAKSKAYWWFFTDKDLNTDTLVRLAYAHYVSAFALFVVAFFHAVDIHYDWKNDFNHDNLINELQWWNEVFINELFAFFDSLAILFVICLYLYTEPEALSYELFMWGDVGLITEPNFNQVAPHWYFRPLMAFLLVVPHAIFGVAGLGLFFILIYYQVSINQMYNLNYYKAHNDNFTFLNKFLLSFKSLKINVDFNAIYQLTFYLFVLACLYTTTFLPNGKYYQYLGGNIGMLSSYFYVLLYLSFPNLKTLTFSNNEENELKLKSKTILN